MSGRVVFGDDMIAFEGATLSVRLEDSTYADAPARVLAESVTNNVAASTNRDSLSFELVSDDASGASVRRTLRVFIDVDGDGRIGIGDYLNTASVVVPETGDAGVTVAVKRIADASR